MPCSPRGDALLRPSSYGRWFVGPGWGRRTSERNYPSVRGGTTRFKSPQQAPFVVRNLYRRLTGSHLNVHPALPIYGHARHRRVHRISFRVRDDRDTPLVWNETAMVMKCFEQKGNRNIFREGAGQPKHPRLCPTTRTRPRVCRRPRSARDRAATPRVIPTSPTRTIYSQRMPNMQESAAAAVDDGLRAAIDRRRGDGG